MNVSLKIGVLAAIVVAVQSACCPQPESEGKCGCCPDACCCMCENVVVDPGSPGTIEVCPMQGLDIVFIVDSSSSIQISGWDKIMQFLCDFTERIGGIGTDVRVAFIRFFGLNAELVWNLEGPQTADLATLKAAFLAVPYNRSFTNTPAGLHIATTEVFAGANGDRPDALYPDIAFLLSDGYTNEEIELLPQRSQELRDATLHLYAIATGIAPNYTELNLIADGDNNQSVFYIPILQDDAVEQQRLVDVMEQDVKDALCYFQPSNAPPTVVEHCKCCCPPMPMQPEPMCGCPASTSGTPGRRR